MENGTRIAAVDLGSNSFRLEIAQYDMGLIHSVEYHKETVRQGSGLDADKVLSQEAMQRGWNCLARFGERLAGFEPSRVRAVATQTLREARNRDAFLSVAKKLLGFDIDVITGREEARLIYQGVTNLLPQSDERRLVVDIGGRSTEMIIGQGFDAKVMESFRVGSVAWSMRYFPDGNLSAKNFANAQIAAKAVLDEAQLTHSSQYWDVAYGSSGTAGAVAEVLFLAQKSPEAGMITRDGLNWLLERLIEIKKIDAIKLKGMKEERKAVIGGGIAVLKAIFDLLGIEQMFYAQGALRQGALLDLIEREDERDMRQSSVENLAVKFNTNPAQAERVSKAAVYFFGQLGGDIPPAQKHQFERQVQWAAKLHEIGTRISHSNYHKHGAYILDNADIAGFSMYELHRLGQLVLGQRGKLRKLETSFDDVNLMRQVLSLRLALILCHARKDPEYQALKLSEEKIPAHSFNLNVPQDWANSWPQSAYLLQEEVLAWQKTPLGLAIS